MDYFKGS